MADPVTHSRQQHKRPHRSRLLHDEDAVRHAEVVSEDSRAVVGRSQRAPMPPVGPAASLVMLVLGIWAYVGQFVLHYSFDVRGQNTALRDTGFAVVIVLTALYLLLVKRSRLASALGLLWGALLVVAGLVTAHAAAQSAVNEIVIGCGVILCAAGTWRR